MWSGPPQSRPESPSSPSHRRTFSEHTRQSPRAATPRLWDSETAGTSSNAAARSKQDFNAPTPTTPDSPFGPMSPGVTDRLFPIRSFVSVDPTPTPYIRTGETSYGFPGMVPPSGRRYSITSVPSVDQASDISQNETPSKPSTSAEISLGTSRRGSNSNLIASEDRKGSGPTIGDGEAMVVPRRMKIHNDDTSTMSDSIASTGGGILSRSGAASIKSNATDGGLTTARFKHVVTDGGHAIITGRDGDTLQRCEDEPIHIPGAVQGFGLLIAMQEGTEGKLSVRVASENAKKIIGYSPRELFELENFCDILSEEQADNLLDHLEFIRDDEADPATNGPEVFTLAIRSPTKKLQKLWCAMHINESNPEMIICEFEVEDDPDNPLVPANEAATESPEDTLQSHPTEEELAESTVISSRPLRVLRSARKRKGEEAAMEVFNIMSQVQEQLAGAPNLEKFLKVLCGVVKELTGFHRVMIYQFDQAWNGRVVTELVDPRATKDLYKGLNFPASDIPKQARDLYKLNKVRLLYDRDQETARLVCKSVSDLETPLDLTYSYLRAMSPIHIKYLANMGVRASMSISINAFNELWGLIACHAYGSKGMRVSFPIRKMCRVIGDGASRNIERLSYASRLQCRKLINTAPSAENPSGYIIASSDDLLKLFDADYGLLSIRDETKILGQLDQTQEALAMLEYLRLRKSTSVLSSQDLRVDFPDLRYPPGFSVIAGLLFVPLSVSGNDFIVFFRRGQVSEVKWAGNPYEKFVKEGTDGYLEPRKSFKTWSEVVVGKCREWTEEQTETAAVLCLVYGKFIEVWRQKEAALQNSQLTKLLLANSAHEVRTPLNAIINYLEIALEGSIDTETRENLAKSHSASKSLICVINDLLDLTKTEEGHELIKDEVFDLPATVREATDVFKGDAKRKQIEYEVIENPGVPQLVIGDQRRLRQCISNVTANAIKNTTSGTVKVELWLAQGGQDHVEIDIVIQDTGVGMSAEKLDALFRDLEQVQSEGDERPEDLLTPDTKSVTQAKSGNRTLGLGLAVVARIIRNMNGQLRLKSEEGKGSRFVIQLGFDLPPQDQKQGSLKDAMQPTTPPVSEGEVLLVNKSAQKPSNGSTRESVTRRNSSESISSIKSTNSFKSFKSGSSAKSDVDRLIGAIQEPHMVARPQSRSDKRLTRSRSRGSKGGRTELLQSASSDRPILSRSQSTAIASELAPNLDLVQSPTPAPPGQASVMDSSTPIKSIRMPEDQAQTFPRPEFPPRTPSKVLFEIPDKPTKEIELPTADHLHVLVAEDDPINSKIIKKRLEKIGHEVFLTVNGEECSSAYGERAALFDVVLMDMQMPIVDGLTSTKMIRSYEKTHPADVLSKRAALNGRVPVFAVSASLVEKNLQTYTDGGFDGWILKPIDFKRLSVLLNGIVEDGIRQSCLYAPGEWERGGWFAKRQPDIFSSGTRPSPQAPVSSFPPGSQPSRGEDPFDDPISREQYRLENLETDAVHAKSEPQEAG